MEPWRQKVPLHRSLHGSNDLRGGPRKFSSNVLVNNWYADRLNPLEADPLTSFVVYQPLYRPTPIVSKRETTYLQMFDYGDWRRRPTPWPKYGILSHDDSGPETWTTEARSQFGNPARRKIELERMGDWPYEGSVYPEHARPPHRPEPRRTPVRIPSDQREAHLRLREPQNTVPNALGYPAATGDAAVATEENGGPLSEKLKLEDAKTPAGCEAPGLPDPRREDGEPHKCTPTKLRIQEKHDQLSWGADKPSTHSSDTCSSGPHCTFVAGPEGRCQAGISYGCR